MKRPLTPAEEVLVIFLVLVGFGIAFGVAVLETAYQRGT